MKQRRILVVEDSAGLAFGLRITFEGEGYAVLTADTLAAARSLIASAHPDLIILDLMLPDGDGFELLTSLRRQGDSVPVIILSARAEETERVAGLKLGADDFVPKPFSVAELVARVGAQFRSKRGHGNVTWIGALRLDFTNRQATRADKPVLLTNYEWRLLGVLLAEAGRPVSRAELIERVWGGESKAALRSVDAFVSSLRAKIEENPDDPDLIITKRGEGYMMVAGSDV